MQSALILAVVSAALWCTSASATHSTLEAVVSMWNVSRPAAQYQQLIPAEGLLLVADVEAGWAVVHAFDELSGRLMWRWNSSWWSVADPPGVVPFLSSQVPDVVFFFQPFGITMVAVDLRTGSARWSYSGCVYACNFLPVVSTDASTIFIDDVTRAVVHAINIASGELLWQFPVQFAYGFTAASCGQAASDCLVVQQSSFNASASLLFVDAQNGALLNSTIIFETFLGASTSPLAAGSVVSFVMENFVLAYSCVNYTLLWNQTVFQLEYLTVYPAGLVGWKAPSVLVASGASLSMQDGGSGRNWWNVSADRLCVDSLPPDFSCLWRTVVSGLLEPREHAVGVVAWCNCWKQRDPAVNFTVSGFLALNTSNGALLWARMAPTLTSTLYPSADRTVTILEQGTSDTSLVVYDSGSFRSVHEWVVPNAPMGPFATSSRVFFLLDIAANSAYTVAGFRRSG